ncbi:MAG: hypothetical protein HRU38_10850 [Saccharospirillaceae bacterium]|nr:hypothetical protein [Saccharospirillaceae bacterium]
MFVQIGVWGSKELATRIMERQYPCNWLNMVDDVTKATIKKLYPIAIETNFQQQVGSIMPKLLRYYDLTSNSEFAIQNPMDLALYKKRMDMMLEPYMDENVGNDSRFHDKDDIQPYPYLRVESTDYFTTHNIYSKYACEDFLRLVHKQLQNLNSKHCYMTQIRAYDPNFDVCYQNISVKAPQLLKDFVSVEPKEIQKTWLGQHEFGYPAYELENQLGEVDELLLGDSERIITPKEMNEFIVSGLIDKTLVSKLELQHNIKWIEEFDPNHVSFMYDLLGMRAGQNFTITHSTDLQLLDFDWDSLE